MDRVVAAIDRLIEDGSISEPVIVQSAAFGVHPRHADAVSVVEYERLSGWMHDARVVICHGGPATILEVLAAGKVPRVVPRDPRYGEHVDGHQQRFVRWLALHRPIIPVWDVAELAEAIKGDPPALGGSAQAMNSRAVARLIELIETTPVRR